jgi:hypothetical protein
MNAIFVDTSGFAALENGNDANHSLAIAFQRQVADQRLRLLTSNFVLDETYAWLRVTLSHMRAVSFGASIQHSKVVEVVYITPDLEREAWEMFARYGDKDFSYTDCTSFALMQHISLDTAFAFDRHFSQFGLRVLP